MHNFKITFSHPWLLLLLIPAVALTLIPYFRLSKKYRKTRNRITSIVLHLIVMFCSIFALCGTMFEYQVNNTKNEIILLVDVSDTEEESAEKRDDFIETVIHDAKFANIKVGIVTFGFDQVYAVPITDEYDDVFDLYKEAELPDKSATDIAAALSYAKTLFNNPDSGKIVVVTDAKETDENASTVIRAVAAQGITVDTAYVSSSYSGTDVMITNVSLPNYHVNVNEECSFGVTLQSNGDAFVKVELEDNGVADTEYPSEVVDMKAGEQVVIIKHQFKTEGFHELVFTITVEGGDSLVQNNIYRTSYNLETFNKVLILEAYEGDSDAFMAIVEEAGFDVSIINITADGDSLPKSVDELRQYDQIIMNNIAFADIEAYDGLEQNLYSYVYDFGGSLFTTGGDDGSGNAHSYNRMDMAKSKYYKQMLPVETIKYTPPLGVIIIIDSSGSMGMESNGGTLLEWAKAGAASCLDALSERDYVGIMTLGDDYDMILPLTPRTKEPTILAAIDSLGEASGGTVFSASLDRAGQALSSLKAVDRRHIIIVTDGGVNEEQGANGEWRYETVINDYYTNHGITVSVVWVGNENEELMRNAAALGHGALYQSSGGSDLIREMREDLNVKEIKEVNYEDYKPIIANSISPVVLGLEHDAESESMTRLNFTLGGFYGVRVRQSADLILMGEYQVPVYAQWKFGKGMVGSFMCDVKGTGWSADLIGSETGKKFLINAITNLLPVESIRPNGFEVDISGDNYVNKMSIYANLQSGEMIKGEIIDETSPDKVAISLNEIPDMIDEGCYVTSVLSDSNNYSRCSFVVRRSGIYKIVLTKCREDGTELATFVEYRALSYSTEYTHTPAEEVELNEEKLMSLAEKGNGVAIADLKDPWEVVADFITMLDRSYDPRIVLMIISIVLFLTDIAVRKFKFKWPHELIREFREKRAKR